MIKAGTIIFSGCADNRQDALEYIAKYGLTSDDVSLRQVMDDKKEIIEIYIKAKRNIELCENQKF